MVPLVPEVLAPLVPGVLAPLAAGLPVVPEPLAVPLLFWVAGLLVEGAEAAAPPDAGFEPDSEPELESAPFRL